MKLKSYLAFVLFLLAAAAHKTPADRKLALAQLTRLRSAVGNRSLIDCVIELRQQQADPSPCFGKANLSADFGSQVVSVTDAILDQVYNQRQCLNLSKPELVRTCISQLKRDLKRYLAYKPRGFGERAEFLELIKSIVQMIADRPHHGWGGFRPPLMPPPQTQPITLNINNNPGHSIGAPGVSLTPEKPKITEVESASANPFANQSLGQLAQKAF